MIDLDKQQPAAEAELAAAASNLAAVQASRQAVEQRHADCIAALESARADLAAESLALADGKDGAAFGKARDAVAAAEAKFSAIDTIALPAARAAETQALERTAQAEAACADLKFRARLVGEVLPADEVVVELLEQLAPAIARSFAARSAIASDYPELFRAMFGGGASGTQAWAALKRSVPPPVREFMVDIFDELGLQQVWQNRTLEFKADALADFVTRVLTPPPAPPAFGQRSATPPGPRRSYVAPFDSLAVGGAPK